MDTSGVNSSISFLSTHATNQHRNRKVLKSPNLIKNLSFSREGEISYDIPYMWNLKIHDMNKFIYKIEADLQIQRTNLWLLGGRMRGRDSQGVWDGQVHTITFKMDNQQGPTVQYRGLCSMLCGSLDGKGVWRRMDTCICMAKSLFCLPETVTTLLISYTPIQNKKFN